MKIKLANLTMEVLRNSEKKSWHLFLESLDLVTVTTSLSNISKSGMILRNLTLFHLQKPLDNTILGEMGSPTSNLILNISIKIVTLR